MPAGWPWIFGVAGVCMFFTWFPLVDTDLWWHLAAGREMVARHAWLFSDPFSATPTLTPWIDLQWGFQLGVYFLFVIGGTNAILTAKLALVGMIVMLLCLIIPGRRYRIITASLSVAVFYCGRYLFVERPIVLTLVMIVAYLACFERFTQSGRRRWLLPVIPMQIVWTNCQGLFIIGVFIVGAYWVEALVSPRQRGSGSRSALLAGTITACFINPWGWRGAALPLSLFQRILPATANLYSANIAENVPLIALTGPDAVYRTLVITITLIILLVHALNRTFPRLSHGIILAGFLYLALCAQRNIVLYCVAVIPFCAIALAQNRSRQIITAGICRQRKTAILAAMIVVAIMVFIHSSVVRLYPRHSSVAPFRLPVAAADYLERHPAPGRMFNASWYGGYLIWRLFPQDKVFIDGRFIIRTPEFFTEYLDVCDHPERFDALAKKYDISRVVIPFAIFTRYRALLRWLYQRSGWQLAFLDGASVIFVKSDPVSGRIDCSNTAVIDSIAATLAERWRDDPYIRTEALGYLRESIAMLMATNSSNVP
jgi:hypothetical protein